MLALTFLLVAMGAATEEQQRALSPLQRLVTEEEDPALLAPPRPAARAQREPPAQAEKGMFIIPKFGAGAVVASGFAVAAGLEIGYRLPLLQRVIGVSAEINFINPSSDDGLETSAAYAVSTRVLVSGNFSAGPGLLRVLAGPSLQWVRTVRTNPASTSWRDTLSLGFTTGVGYFFRLPTGALGGEAKYEYFPEAGHALMLQLGYLWAF